MPVRKGTWRNSGVHGTTCGTMSMGKTECIMTSEQIRYLVKVIFLGYLGAQLTVDCRYQSLNLDPE